MARVLSQTNLFTTTKQIELILQREHIIHSLKSMSLEQKKERQSNRKDVIPEETYLKHRNYDQKER